MEAFMRLKNAGISEEDVVIDTISEISQKIMVLLD